MNTANALTNVLGIGLIAGIAYYVYAKIELPDDDDDDPQVVNGCMDNTAKNYNPDATADDGSCEFAKGDKLKCPSGYSPVKIANGNWKCVKMVDPREGDKAKSIMDNDGKTFTIPHPKYNKDTVYGRLWKPYSISCKLVVDSTGVTATGQSQQGKLVLDFDPVGQKNWSKTYRGNKNSVAGDGTPAPLSTKYVTRVVSHSTQWAAIQLPTWNELFQAIGGQRAGAKIGPSVLFRTIVNNYPQGQTALMPSSDGSNYSTRVNLNIKTGNVIPEWKLYVFTKCGNSNWAIIPNTNGSPIQGSYWQHPETKVWMWNSQKTIPSNVYTYFLTVCPPQVKTVTPPLEIGVDDGLKNSLGYTSFTPYILSGTPATSTLTISTFQDDLLWKNFYSKTKPNVYKNEQGQLMVTTNIFDTPANRTDALIPHTYTKKTYSCNCPNESVNAGQTVQTPLPCSNYAALMGPERREELIALCGGRPSTGGGLNGMVKNAEWKDKSKSYTNYVNIHQYLEKYINLFR